MTDAEYARVLDGFEEHAQEHDRGGQQSERLGYVAEIDGRFIGVSSGLAYRNADGYGDWFYLSDLFVEKPHRGAGVGSQLLTQLEECVSGLGIGHIYTWTTEDGPHRFYARHGYRVFLRQGGYFAHGIAQLGLTKALPPGRPQT